MGKYYPVLVEDIYFDSVRKASKELNICSKYIHKRCKSEDWPNYEYTKWRIPDKKKCSTCKKILSLDQFFSNINNRDRKSTECKRCSTESVTRRRQENKDEYRNTWLQRVYGINLDSYNILFENQKGCCAICNVHQSQLNKSLFVDHDHSTGQVRGLLCTRCNTGIGMLNDDIDVLDSGIEYLKKYNND